MEMKAREIRRYGNEDDRRNICEGEGDKKEITEDWSTPILNNESEGEIAA